MHQLGVEHADIVTDRLILRPSVCYYTVSEKVPAQWRDMWALHLCKGKKHNKKSGAFPLLQLQVGVWKMYGVLYPRCGASTNRIGA